MAYYGVRALYCSLENGYNLYRLHLPREAERARREPHRPKHTTYGTTARAHTPAASTMRPEEAHDAPP